MAKRLIDAEALGYTRVRIFHGLKEDGTPCVGGWNAVVMSSAIRQAPTVDAVEVVRCKDCKNWMYEFEDIGLCVADVPDIDGVQRCANDFCSYGKRRDEA